MWHGINLSPCIQTPLTRLIYLSTVCLRFGKENDSDKAAGIKAKQCKMFLLTMEGCDEEADREAWAAFEEMLSKKAASAPAHAFAVPIGDPAPPAPAVLPDAAGTILPPAAGAAAPGAPPAPQAWRSCSVCFWILLGTCCFRTDESCLVLLRWSLLLFVIWH